MLLKFYRIQLKRHSQVKTWTRRVDIFSKDYIIIPVYLNFHWFLAVICFPGQVPDATPNVPAKSDAKLSKSAGNSQTQGRNSTNSSTLYEGKEPLDSEPIPEASDSSTRPDGNHGGQRLKMPCICIFDSLNIPNRWKIAAILRDYLNVEWTSKKGSRKIFDRHTMNEYIMRCPQQTNMHDCGVYLLENFEKFFQNPFNFKNPMPDLSNWFDKNRIREKRNEIKELILNLKKEQLANSATNARQIS
ncbi:sentrin-specific protease 6-like isoform X2 [Stegodyphus dumicola]|uniref:sentrin-specific protease 6-like isoform X2 n=1 Tax=Stegodyphus dumicola TaxID=202533 RepID=UPI0015AA5036|nr:sentrin-specific protease 6-like isoform X2 [Stegodyphus dumicola]